MLVVGFPAGPWETNCWVVAPDRGEQCVVIDPGYDAVGQLDEVIAEHRLQPVAVLLSHGHVDHTWSVAPVCGAQDVPALIHPADRVHAHRSERVAGHSVEHADHGAVRVGGAVATSASSPTARRCHSRARPDRRLGARSHQGIGDVHLRRGLLLRRPAVRRVDRAHRPARRLVRARCRSRSPACALRAARRDRRPSRSRPRHDDRPGADGQPVPRRSAGCGAGRRGL